MTEPLDANWPNSVWDISKPLKDERDAARTAAAAWEAAAEEVKADMSQAEKVVEFWKNDARKWLQKCDILTSERDTARRISAGYLCNCNQHEMTDPNDHGLYCKYRRKMEEEVEL